MSAHQKKLRCAVYTRKSTEEGLDQEFNSLDAQREACVAFISSQGGMGWRPVTDHYDDGGISGGTMERPALKRLLQDIRDRKVDVVVVYKIDRLTRSLMDFSKIVEVFDANDVSFVSVTQQFNTTTSMGRLTLNVLLSFAQFEREVTAERIRDKIAASRKKGIWMGGTVPLGYRAVDKKLVIDTEAANRVRGIFSRYLEVKSAPVLVDELNGESGINRDSLSSRRGRLSFTRGKLYHLLSNVVYIGKARHKDRIYNGEHEPIIDEERFAAVQALLKGQAPNRRNGSNVWNRHLLTGLLFDETDDRLSPVFTVKDGKRYRYYISNRLETTTRNDPSGWRLPADELERTVLHRLDAMLRDDVRLSEWAGMMVPAIPVHTAIAMAGAFRDVLQTSSPEQVYSLRRLVRAIHVKPGEIVFNIDPHAVIGEVYSAGSDHVEQPERDPVTISVPMTLRRRGAEAKLVLEGQSPSRKPDDGLVEALAKAHVMLGMLTDDSARTIAEVANETGIHVADVSRILPLAFLAPKITDAILRGRQPVELTARALMRDDLPHLWSDQLQQFGI
ncbi:recombinase family protein [Mesorhizobium sp. YM1C-6-2]|uniref:recombinase family protein n=1 Tax=Mesorhizobium sp. YM1C-6-2 TaxID=1827501 RepID=UPI000EF18B6E|nr:recombinase family protein [Mesorhizobium sp. YM1C-6-2]RLP23987.1 recombinase family protein [Mesorhizobium sp. YM1C-6-2]